MKRSAVGLFFTTFLYLCRNKKCGLQGLIDRADSGKLKKARGRLARAPEPEMLPEGKA